MKPVCSTAAIITVWACQALGQSTLAQSTSSPAAKTGDYATEFQRSYQYAGPRNQENLDRIKTALLVPQTRLAALRELIDFAVWSMYQVGSTLVVYEDGSGEIRSQAGKVAHAAADEATVLAALRSSDPLLVTFGIWHFNDVHDVQAGMDVLERLVRSPDDSLRSRAAEILIQHGKKDLVAPFARTEKSPWVLESMTPEAELAGGTLFNTRLEGLLTDADVAVRKNTINFVGSAATRNSSRRLKIDGPLMDSLLACAASKGGDAELAFDTFKTLANRTDLSNTPQAAAWWKDHRADWECARFPRGLESGPIHAAILTMGAVGGAPAWEASVILENHGKDPVWINVSEAVRLGGWLDDQLGQHSPVHTPQPPKQAEWLLLQPGQSTRQSAAIDLDPSNTLTPGRYLLRASVVIPTTDVRNAPVGANVFSGELPLPDIVVEAANRRR